MRFAIHGDCLCPLLTGADRQSRKSELVPLMIASTTTALQTYRVVEAAHIKLHNGHAWNERADVFFAKHCAIHVVVGFRLIR